MLFPGDAEFTLGVKATLIIENSEVSIYPGRSGASLFKGLPNTDMITVRLGSPKLDIRPMR